MLLLICSVGLLSLIHSWSEMVSNMALSIVINPYPAKLNYLNFQPLEAASRYRDPQLQVAENY